MNRRGKVPLVTLLGHVVIGCVLLGALLKLSRTFGMNIPGEPVFGLMGIATAIALLAYLAWAVRRSQQRRKDEDEDGRVVVLREFLSDPVAVIAPNYEEVGEDLRDWLVEFRDRKGEDSVWVRRHEDAPSASEVFLVVDELTKGDREALMGFQADGIAVVGPGVVPGAGEGRRVYGVVWD